MTRQVAQVYEVEPLGTTDIIGAFQSRLRRRRQIPQQILRVKPGEVHGRVLAQIGFDPLRQFLEFRIGVVQGRHYKVYDFAIKKPLTKKQARFFIGEVSDEYSNWDEGEPPEDMCSCPME